MKLWQKNSGSTKEVETFTVGKDRELDMYLAPFDVLGSLAHIQMLADNKPAYKRRTKNLATRIERYLRRHSKRKL